MSGEGTHCNGDVKLMLTYRDGGMITYSRKRARPGAQLVAHGEGAIDIEEDGSASAAGEVPDKRLSRKRGGRDIGWDHAVQVNGNRFHWRCNWCGLVRAGGVSRLKQHLAGGPVLRKCPMVPENVAKIMRKHLSPGALKGLDERESQRHRLDDDKEHKYLESATHETNATRRFKRSSNHSRGKRSRIATQQSKIDIDKGVIPDSALCMSFFDQAGVERVDRNWRNILGQMLQLPDVSEGGGIQSCIHSALRSSNSVSSRKAKRVDINEDITEPKGRYEEHYELHCHSQRPGCSVDGASNMFKRNDDKVDIHDNTMKCQNVFLKILCSEKFALLCDLLCGSHIDRKALEMVDFSLINTKMKNGEYERSPGLFNQDIQQVWEKLKKVAQVLFHLANSLSNSSLASFQKQVIEDLTHESGEQVLKETCEVGCEQRNSIASNTTTQLPSYESDQSTKPEQTESSYLYKVCTCKKCGTEADGKRSLICDGCEAMYHFSCIEPAIQEIPIRSWYCGTCMTNRKGSPEPPLGNKRKSAEPLLRIGMKSPERITNSGETPEPALDIQQDRLHEDCVVCDRLDIPEADEHPNETGSPLVANGSKEGSVSSMESDEPPEPSRTAVLRLCKQCGTCEDDDKLFLVCGHTHCPYKYYHIRCLKTSQIASQQQRNLPCWYCPSCLCRGCFSDTDDDKIVLCDGCDESYHIYCMRPPRTSIPEGQWYCISCNVARARDGMRRYEQLILQQHGKKDARQDNEEVKTSMDILLIAAEKLSSEEQLTVEEEDK